MGRSWFFSKDIKWAVDPYKATLPEPSINKSTEPNKASSSSYIHLIPYIKTLEAQYENRYILISLDRYDPVEWDLPRVNKSVTGVTRNVSKCHCFPGCPELTSSDFSSRATWPSSHWEPQMLKPCRWPSCSEGLLKMSEEMWQVSSVLRTYDNTSKVFTSQVHGKALFLYINGSQSLTWGLYKKHRQSTGLRLEPETLQF